MSSTVGIVGHHFGRQIPLDISGRNFGGYVFVCFSRTAAKISKYLKVSNTTCRLVD